ncbi:MAG TPA: sigma-54 dependent transcriptional regulator [Kofleriaceae bacterium]|jgi:DNA-binding NtrC family response regulator|nr:sigma-54 dependent transcriptional regulator [Kofleriaceae bacterium]
MLIRVAVVCESAALRRRAERLAALPDAVVESGARSLRELGDLPDGILVERALLEPDMPAAIRRVVDTPERPALVVLAEREDQHQRAALLAAGAAAVLPVGLSDDELQSTLATIFYRQRDERTARDFGPDARPQLDDFATANPAMQELHATALKVADSDTSLLILGETGTGKEWLARAIHNHGARATAPFVPVNCAAIPEALLESEFFGHERGAFTGALRARRGHFELAHRGTLFLDEIGDLPASVQAKLLRVLQEHEIQPVGAERTLRVDVRVIAATNRDLAADVDDGRFRRDLYYRLGVVTLYIPPLRDRREDIPDLVRGCLAWFSARLRRPVREVDPAALNALVAYGWPGNVREMFNVIERAVLLCAGNRLGLGDLPEEVARGRRRLVTESGPRNTPLPPVWIDRPWRVVRSQALAELERRYLSELLRATSGRVGQAARRAGMDPRSLFEKMRKHGLRRSDFQPEGEESDVEPPIGGGESGGFD